MLSGCFSASNCSRVSISVISGRWFVPCDHRTIVDPIRAGDFTTAADTAAAFAASTGRSFSCHSRNEHGRCFRCWRCMSRIDSHDFRRHVKDDRILQGHHRLRCCFGIQSEVRSRIWQSCHRAAFRCGGRDPAFHCASSRSDRMTTARKTDQSHQSKASGADEHHHIRII